MAEAYIIDAVRTPVGKRGGGLAGAHSADLGAHVIKVGLAPLIVDLIERGFVSGVMMNGAGCVHDLELAMMGRTSEDVAEALDDGSFGMAGETAERLNQAIAAGARARHRDPLRGEADRRDPECRRLVAGLSSKPPSPGCTRPRLIEASRCGTCGCSAVSKTDVLPTTTAPTTPASMVWPARRCCRRSWM